MNRLFLTFLPLMLIATIAIAQTVTPTVDTATPQSTVITLNDVLRPWIELLAYAAVPVILGMVGAIFTYIKKKFNLEQDVAFAQMEKNARDALQSALTNAAGRSVLLLGDKLKDQKLDVKMPEIREAILLVNKSAGDAVSQFKMTDEDIAKKIIDKIGVITAPNPVVIPTTDPIDKRV